MGHPRKFLFLVLSVFLHVAVFTATQAQEKTLVSEELPFPGQFMKREPEGNYLAPLVELKKREAAYTASDEWREVFFDMMAYANSYVGNYSKAIIYEDKNQPKGKLEEIKSSELDDYRPKKALDVIAAAADRERVIMINELHHVPMHRAFAARMLPILYKKGFRYLAVEAVAETDTQLNERGYPIYDTGGYTDEPIFGDMLRTALKLGFKIVPYEHRTQIKCVPPADNPYFCQNERERGQAQNIYERILREQPAAKIFVYAGGGHIQESRDQHFSPMATHFKDISGVNPFTVDQIMMMEFSTPVDEEPEYRYVERIGLVKEPTVFQSRAGSFWKIKRGNFSTVDALIFHPRVVNQNNRPVWLQMGNIRKPLILKADLWMKKELKPASSNSFLLQAFAADEAEGAVPIDQVVVSGTVQKAVLMLPRGKFRIRAIDESGKQVGQYETKHKVIYKNTGL